MTAPLRLPHWIGGAPLEAGSRGLETRSPGEPERVVARAVSADAATVRRAVDRAAQAADELAQTPGPQRAAWLLRWARAVEQAADELAAALVAEVGKPIGEARGEVARAAAILTYFAGEAVRDGGSVIPAQSDGALQLALRRPLGVVGLITPWNFPLAIPIWKAAPALAFGNAVVWKGSERALLCSDLLVRTAHAAGLPPGAIALLHGDGETGASLCAEPGVAAVSFTGSGAAGRRVAVACTERGARVQAEMGGKNVAVILADADLPRAARAVAGGAFRYAGQKCTATSRVVVDAAVLGPFVDELRKAAAELAVLPPQEERCAVGPVISHDARSRIDAAVAAAGGETLWSGTVPRAPGHWVVPQILGGLAPDASLAQQELFGPVLCLFTAGGIDDAIRLANATRYGLSASLFTRDLNAAMDWVARIEAGMVRVNADTTGVDPHAPFGGIKESGYGGREQGPAARAFYTELRTVQIER